MLNGGSGQTGRSSTWLDHTEIIAFWLTLVCVAVLIRPPLPVDETRYLSVAWEMFHTGDWLVPTRNFAPYDHKPPLLFWLINAAWNVTGFSVPVARFLALFQGLFVVWLTIRLGRRLWPQQPEAGSLAGLAYGGSILIATYASMVMFDQLLTAGILIAVTAICDAALRQRWRGRDILLLGLGLGIGILAKGPVAAISIILVGISWYWWKPSQSVQTGSSWAGGLTAGILLGAAIALAWAIPAVLAGGEDYAERLLWKQTAGRMNDSFAHKKPFWWYLTLAPALFAPWILWPRLWQATGQLFCRGDGTTGTEQAQRDWGIRMALIWLLGGLVVFSLVSGKKPHYLIQLMPALALLVGRTATRIDELTTAGMRNLTEHGWLDALLHRLIALPALLMLIICAAIALQPPFLPSRIADLANRMDQTAALGGMVVALLMLGYNLFVLPRRNGAETVRLLTWQSLLIFCCVHAVGGGFARREFSPMPMASYLSAHLGERPLATVGRYDGELGAFVPLVRPVDQIDRDEIAPWLRAHPTGWVLLRDRHPNQDHAGTLVHTARYRDRDWLLLGQP